VNLAEGPTFVLLDYKLGQLPTVGAIKDGIDLQFPVYAIGAPRVLPRLAEVPCGSWHYWSLSGNLKLLPSAARPVGVDSVREVLASVLPRAAQYVDGLRDGWCSVQGQSCPQYCDFRDVCRITPWMRLKESDAEPEEDGA
jgi:hypothetical protein